MGINFLSSSSSYDSAPSGRLYDPTPPPRGNPVPWRFEVLRTQQVGPHVVAEVQYPDADNYEGRKILVYLDQQVEGVLNAKVLDPHFSNSKKDLLSPFARFEPTEAGWKAALRIAGEV